MARMSGLQKIRVFINRLEGDKLFSAGIMGATSNLQNQTEELRRKFALWSADLKNDKLKEDFVKALYTAGATSVITKEELEYCQRCVEDIK